MILIITLYNILQLWLVFDICLGNFLALNLKIEALLIMDFEEDFPLTESGLGHSSVDEVHGTFLFLVIEEKVVPNYFFFGDATLSYSVH